MESAQIIANSIQYIETHLSDPLSADQLASLAGFSTYHFCHLFAGRTGVPVMEYIRRRRLAHAAEKLWTGRKIVDVAADCGFDTHAGFAKAFKKIYGYPPQEYCRRITPHRPMIPNPLAGMQPASPTALPSCRIEYRDGFYIAGVILRTVREQSRVSQLPALWREYTVFDLDSIIYAKARPREHGEYNLCFPAGGGLFRHVNGVKLDSLEDIDKDLYVDFVPPALCAVFTTAPVQGSTGDFVAAIQNCWNYIQAQWLPDSGYREDPEGREYEFYDARTHGDGPYSMEICIPLIARPNVNPQQSCF